jgi:hypothetical protein
MVEFMQHGTTITSQMYCETLKNTAYGDGNADMRCSAPP